MQQNTCGYPGLSPALWIYLEKTTATSADFVSYDTSERPVFLALSYTANIVPLICTDLMVVPSHFSDSTIINCSSKDLLTFYLSSILE